MKLKIFLLIIISLGFALRVWEIGTLPIGFTPDEASFGYDAYSLLKTGKDQWGHSWPLVLESFGDYKMPLYSYIAMPFVWIFGLNKFAVRLPNAILGTLAIYIIYLLVKKMFGNSNIRKLDNLLAIGNWKLEIIASFLLAISPWHIMMSRGAFEANLTTFLMPLGIYLFLKGIENNKYLNLSAIVFGLNLFSYHSARLVTPLIVIALLVIYRKDLLKNYKAGILKKVFAYKLPILIFSLFLGLAFYTLTLGSGRRAADVSIFSGSLQEASSERFVAMYQGMSEKSARIFHNKYQVSVRRFIANYFQYSSFNFLFLNGPAEATYGMTPGKGVLYFFELPLLVAFLFSFFKFKDKKVLYLLLAWILIAPIPAALTTGRGYAANRAVIMLPALTIASSIGAYVLYDLIKKYFRDYVLKFVNIVFTILIVFSFAAFFEYYFILSPYKNAKEMLYGNLEAAEWISENSDEKSEVIVSRSLSEPHIYFAFANLWDPIDYQNNSKNWDVYKENNLKFLDQLGEYHLGKYTFSGIGEESFKKPDSYLVGKVSEFAPEQSSKIRFLYPDGETAIVVVEPFKEAFAISM